jgi:CelD/BcsL family acetyltransferase involved in cellulose biosynthesis
VHFIRQPVTLGEYPNPFVTLPSFRNADGAHSTRLGEDWESYYHARRGKGWRRTDRNKLKKLGELGEVSFVTARSPAQRDDILAALFSQKAKGLARAGVSDMFAPPGVRSFYASLAERAWPDGPTHLCALYCGEQIVAANLGVVRGDTYYYVLHAYDVDNLASLSPGRQLMYEIMQWSIANGIDRFDFTIGDEAYKDTWCDETLELYDSVVPMTLRGHTAALTYRLLQNTKRIVKSQRHLWTMARFMRTQLRRSRIG